MNFKISILYRFILILMLANIIVFNFAYGQCVPIGGSSGTVQNSTMSDSVNFTVTLSPTCSFTNLGTFTGVCGLTFPGIVAPWSGNTNGSTSTVTYAFSSAINSVDILIGYTGVNGITAPETFLFSTNSNAPTLTVNSGTCIQWSITGTQTTSPSIVGGLNSIHTISSNVAFDSLTITTNSSGTGPGANGGSSFALCDASIITGTNDYFSNSLLKVYPNPTDGIITVSLPEYLIPNNSGILRIYNNQGKIIRNMNLDKNNRQLEISLIDEPSGVYYLKISTGNDEYVKRFLISSE